MLLKTLIAISDKGSFSAAADHVNVSHAAVGQQMKRLEETLNVTLFDRSRNTPQLNQLAQALVPKAREVVHSYETLLDDLTGDAELIGELSLGAVPSTIRSLVPQSIKALVQNYPKLQIRVVPGLSGDLHEQVERGALDAAILSAPDVVAASLKWQPFAEEELILLASPEVTESDPLRLMQELPFIRHTRRADVGMMADAWLSANGIQVHTSMEMESIESVTSMVSHNLGVSIVPNVCVPDPIFAGLRKIQLPSEKICRVLGVLSRTDCSKVRLVDRLLEQVQKTVKSASSSLSENES